MVAEHDVIENKRTYRHVGDQVFEVKIPSGLRLYTFPDTLNGQPQQLVIAICGGKKGNKKEQDADIAKAKQLKKRYHYEIRSHRGAGSSLFDHVESSVVTISKDKHGYRLIYGSPAITQFISVDGQFFSWEDNESDDGYADNYHVGRIDNGIVTGRTYYVHFDDIGIEHFKLSPVMPTSSPSGNN